MTIYLQLTLTPLGAIYWVHATGSSEVAKPEPNDERGENCGKKSVRISSLLNGLFDTPKQGAQSCSDELRLFKPRKISKSLQNLAVSLSQPDRGLRQIRQMPHDNRAVARQIPNCVAYVWRRQNQAWNLGYGT